MLKFLPKYTHYNQHQVVLNYVPHNCCTLSTYNHDRMYHIQNDHIPLKYEQNDIQLRNLVHSKPYNYKEPHFNHNKSWLTYTNTPLVATATDGVIRMRASTKLRPPTNCCYHIQRQSTTDSLSCQQQLSILSVVYQSRGVLMDFMRVSLHRAPRDHVTRDSHDSLRYQVWQRSDKKLGGVNSELETRDVHVARMYRLNLNSFIHSSDPFSSCIAIL